MATKMGVGAPGVLIGIEDNSGYSTMVTPAVIGGIVGFSAKGELNKILDITNSGELDAILGYGYNNSKYNQGLYAARAVIDNGGAVEFIRPYGEEIDKSNPYKRDLKSDAFVVTYDRNAAMYTDIPKTSLQMKHFAATRFKTDGAAAFGVTRKVNNISETVETGKNVNFLVNAGDEFADSNACRYYDATRKKAPTDTVLFSVINKDPSSANRAYDTYEVVSVSTNKAAGTFELTLGSQPMFAVGDLVYFPIGGQNNDFGSGSVMAIDEYSVVISPTISPTDTAYIKNGNRPSVLYFCNDATAVEDGFDYLTVKTAVAGRGVKTFTVMNLANFGDNREGTSNRFSVENSIVSGTCIIVSDAHNGAIPIRIVNNKKNSFDAKMTFTATDIDGVFHYDGVQAGVALFPGDVISFKYVSGSGYASTTATVTDSYNCLCVPNENLDDVSGFEGLEVIDPYISEFSTKIDTVLADITGATSWGDVARIIAGAFRNALIGYNNRIVVNDIIKADPTKNLLVLDPSAAMEYTVGDKIAIVTGTGTSLAKTDTDISDFIASNTSPVIGTTVITSINPMNGEITVKSLPDGVKADADEHYYQLIDLTTAAMDVYASSHTVTMPVTVTSAPDSSIRWEKVEGADSTYGVNCSMLKIGGISSLKDNIHKGDIVSVKDGESSNIDPVPQDYTVIDIINSGVNQAIVVKDPNKTLLDSEATYTTEYVKNVDIGQLFVVGAYSMYVASANQNSAQFSVSEGTTGLHDGEGNYLVDDSNRVLATDLGCHMIVSPGMGAGLYIVDKSSKCLANAEIGETFLSLGLAVTKFEDIEFTGNPKQVFALTSEGESVARLFLGVQYRFNGTLYEFEGTVVPYVLNGEKQLSIEYAASFELADSGVAFLMNESGVLDAFLDNNAYDLSQTMTDGVLDGSSTCISFNPDDPAIMNDAVWVYQPVNNMSTSTLSTVWSLFHDKDESDLAFIVAAGTNINNFGSKNIETLNPQVMTATLNVCESRKDCFALFGGIGEADINKALKKYNDATTFPSVLGRWGAIYDGKGVVFDSIYTKNLVEIDKSVQMAAIVTANRRGSIFWYPPSGKKKGRVPSAWGSSEKYPRRYISAEDLSSDHARLSRIHVNATRSIKNDGLYIWGDWTMQMEDTAFNQIHVAMLLAGIHKMYYHYLDNYVFELNTPDVRTDIQGTIQDSLDIIKTSKPSGFYMAQCICDETNNPQTVIDQGKLYVWVRVRPTKTARWIYLLTELVKTETGKELTTTLR